MPKIDLLHNGTVCGVENPDEVMLQISGKLRDSILPDVIPFLRITTEVIDGKNVVKVSVSSGTNKPYYIQEKGIKPSGVYVRVGSYSQPLSTEGIMQMILKYYGTSFEVGRSINQNLTFNTLSFEMTKKGLEFGQPQMTTLKLFGDDGLYTNLALLLSDQCQHTIKLAVFGGPSGNDFKDRKEFTGSLLKQLEDVTDYLYLVNKTESRFENNDRIDSVDYNKKVLREALLNSIVHRDYSVSASNIINIFKDRIVFISQGGFVQGMDMHTMFIGTSRPRNENLANIFYRLRLIENYGYGVRSINESYANYPKKPIFDVALGGFSLTIPNLNTMQDGSDGDVENDSTSKLKDKNQSEKEKILKYTKAERVITRKDVEKLLDIGTTKAVKLLNDLCEIGKLKALKKGPLSYYKYIGSA